MGRVGRGDGGGGVGFGRGLGFVEFGRLSKEIGLCWMG